MATNNPSTLCGVIHDILTVADLPGCWAFVDGMTARGWFDVRPVYDPPVHDGKFDTTIFGRWPGEDECQAIEMARKERLRWTDFHRAALGGASV